MMGYGFGMGAGGWIAMTIFWVGLIVLAVWLVRYMFSASSGSRGSRGEDSGWRETPEQTLDRRYAAGEIDEETYRSMHATLRSSDSSRRAER